MITDIKYDVIAFLAPQGGGKDTQMDILKARLPSDTTAVLSMSDVLRHYRNTDKEFGDQIDLMMSRGILVGDDIVVGRLMKYLAEECKGKKLILLNGYPRTMAQAFGLWAIAMKVNCPDARMAIIKFNLEHKDAYKRCLHRIEQKKKAGQPVRIDDKPELIEDRLTTYFHNLPEIISGTMLFADVHEIDASRSVDEVTDDIVRVISDSPAEPIS